MTEAAAARVGFILKWLPLGLVGFAFGLAVSLYRDLPVLSALAIIATLLAGIWGITEAVTPPVMRLLVTPAGIKWDWVLLPVYGAVALRYGASVHAQHDVSTFSNFSASLLRMLIFGLACSFTGMSLRMAREIRLKFAKETATEGGDQKAFDWHRDVERYQVPLVWFALGLTLFQMAGPD